MYYICTPYKICKVMDKHFDVLLYVNGVNRRLTTFVARDKNSALVELSALFNAKGYTTIFSNGGIILNSIVYSVGKGGELYLHKDKYTNVKHAKNVLLSITPKKPLFEY